MKNDDHVLQFLIVLDEIEPEVRRCIQVPAWYSMWDLHVAIQDAMGWQDMHLHSFTLPERFGDRDEFGIPTEDDEAFGDPPIRTLPGWLYAVDRVFDAPGTRATYLYDFGDNWMHTVIFEGRVPAEEGALYPRCIEGAQPCPPENCGGPPGYAALLEALANSDPDDARDLAGWLESDVTRYPPFVPGRFDLADITFDDPNERWHSAFADGNESWPGGPPRGEDGRPLAFPLPGTQEDELVTVFDVINYPSGVYPRYEVEYIIRNAEICTPLLLSMLAEAVDDPDGINDDPEYMGHLFALMLVGHLRVAEAHGILARIAYLPDDLPHELFSDTVTENLGAALQRTCAGTYDTIHDIVRSEDADIWVRSAAIDAIQYGVLEGEYPREDALRFFAELLDTCKPDDDPFMASHLAASMVDLHPGEYVDRIKRAYDEDLINPGYMQWEEVLEDAGKSVETCLAGLGAQLMPRHIDDMHASMEWWACFNEERGYKDDSAPVRPAAASKKKKSRRKQEKRARRKNRKK
jgi:hypothetical protein